MTNRKALQCSLKNCLALGPGPSPFLISNSERIKVDHLQSRNSNSKRNKADTKLLVPLIHHLPKLYKADRRKISSCFHVRLAYPVCNVLWREEVPNKVDTRLGVGSISSFISLVYILINNNNKNNNNDHFNQTFQCLDLS